MTDKNDPWSDIAEVNKILDEAAVQKNRSYIFPTDVIIKGVKYKAGTILYPDGTTQNLYDMGND